MVDTKFGRYSKQCFQPKELFSIFKRKNKICCWSNNKRLFAIRLVTGQKISLRDLPHILHVFFFIVSVASNRMLSPLLYWFLILWQNEAGSAGGQKKGPTKVLGC